MMAAAVSRMTLSMSHVDDHGGDYSRRAFKRNIAQ